MQVYKTAFRVEIIYLDKKNNPTESGLAFKTIIREYDDKNNLIQAHLSIDPSKD